jgi:protein ImuB
MPASNSTGDLFESALPASSSPGAPGLQLASPAGVAARSSPELWLCLHLPQLPLATFDLAAPEPEARLGRDQQAARNAASAARAVIEGQGARQVVVACSEAALRLGVRPGLGVNAALVLAPGLALARRQPLIEAALLERLARWMTQFTPVVSLEPPCTLLAEVRGSLGLFGGVAALRGRVLAGLTGLGFEAQASFAPTPRAALWIARAGLVLDDCAVERLPAIAARLPLSCLGWPDAVLGRLVALGLRSVADLARLPRDGFARRFGPALLDELDEAFGRRRQLRSRAVAPERFDERLDLPVECVSTTRLMPAFEQLLVRLQAFLRVRAAGVRGVSVELRHRQTAPTRLVIGLARPSGDVRHLQLLLRERLERTPLPAPVEAIRLRSTVVVPVEIHAAGLFDGLGEAVDPEAPARLLERLRARLGHDAVFSVCLVPEHRPEVAWRVAEPCTAAAAKRGTAEKGTVPFSSKEKGTVPFSGEAPFSGVAAPRPLWMLATPQPLGERDGVPRHGRAPLELIAGPERIESGWWDGGDVRRDYYVARGRGGLRLWVYRKRDAGGGWWLHGVFG